MNKPYLIATNLEHCLQHNPNIDLTKLEDVNYVCVLKSGYYILASITPPNKVVKAYLQQTDKVVQCTIEELFFETQENSCVWCEV